MAAMNGRVRLPLLVKVGDVEYEIGTVEVDVEVSHIAMQTEVPRAVAYLRTNGEA